MHIHVHIHDHKDDHILKQIIHNQSIIMASQADFQAQLDRIAASIAKLQQNAGGLNATQEDQALATLTSQADQLDALANPQP